MNILLTDSYTYLHFVVSIERIRQKEVFSQPAREENTDIWAVTHLDASDWSLRSKAQQNCVWLVIMRSAVNTRLSLAQLQTANADLNLTAEDVTHWTI